MNIDHKNFHLHFRINVYCVDLCIIPQQFLFLCSREVNMNGDGLTDNLRNPSMNSVGSLLDMEKHQTSMSTDSEP